MATSRAHAHSDAWFEVADQLACNGAYPDVLRPVSTATWTDLMFGIEAQLNSLASDVGGYMVLNVDRRDDPFVQFVVDGLGSIEAEAASTVFAAKTQVRRRVNSITEQRLFRIGWHPPDVDPLRLAEPGEHPNFHWSWRNKLGYPSALFAELGVRTLVEAFEVAEPALVWVRGGYLSSSERPSRV